MTPAPRAVAPPRPGAPPEPPEPAVLALGDVLARYLMGEPPPPEVLTRYAAGVRALRLPLDTPDLRRALRHPGMLPLLDGAAALRAPEGPLRQHLVLMLAVLECRPDPDGRFEPPPGPRGARLVALASGLVGTAARMGLGLLLSAVRRD